MPETDLKLAGTKLFSDTHPAIERKMIELIRTLTSAQKIAKISEMGRFMKSIAFAETKRRHPNDSDHDNMMRVVSRSIGPELMLKAFGWDVKEKGY
jgi:hypothetical protein